MLDGQRLGDMIEHRLHLFRIGLEQQIHHFEIGVAVARRHDLGLAVKQIIAGGVLLIEAHIARRFFQRRDADARVFQQFRRNVGNIFAGDMRAAQLRDRIVAVADQHPLEEGPGFFQGRAVAAGGKLAAEQIFQGELGIAEKFVEESPAQTLGRAAVARE